MLSLLNIKFLVFHRFKFNLLGRKAILKHIPEDRCMESFVYLNCVHL